MNRSLLRSFFFLLCLFAATNSSAQNWRSVFSGMNGHGSASFFFNEMKGFIGFNAVSTNPVVRTTNGGTTWTAVNFAPSLQGGIVHPVTDIWFRDTLTGWMTMWSQTGVDPCLWHTTDGGANWYGMTGLSQMHYPASVRQTTSMTLVTEHPTINGSGTLIPGSLWSSTDSGGTWTRVSSRNIGLAFTGNTYGISTSYRSQFMYTNNGGQSWISAASPNNFVHEAWSAYPWRNAGKFIAIPEDSGGNGSRVYKTKDFTNGYLWEAPKVQLNFMTTGHIAGVDSVLYICNSGQFGSAPSGFYRSLDGGDTWINVGGPTTDQDTRFSVTGCGDVVYAFDLNGQIWKTSNGGGGPPIPQCVFINKDSLGTLTAMVCDSAHSKYWLHNTNYGDVFIQDLRIIDSSRKPWKTGSVYYDSIPVTYASLTVGDSLLIDLGWRPKLLLDSTGNDSAVLRVIFTVPYLGYRFDTIYLPLKLKAISSPAAFALSSASIKADSVDPCVQFDTALTIVNMGCDTMAITASRLSILSAWSLFDSSGNALALPIKLAPNQGLKYRLSAHPNGTKSIKDSLSIKMHYQGHDSTTVAYVEVSGKYIQGVQSTLSPMQFDSVATCVTYDSLVMVSNASCDTITITSADLTTGDWAIIDTAGKPIVYPIRLAPGTHGVFKLRFGPSSTGVKSGRVTLHILNGATASTATMQLSGIGVDNGTFVYSHSFDLGSISICETRDTTIIFRNTTCGTISLRAVQAFGNFMVTDSGILPKDVLKGEAQTLHLRFTPSGKTAQNGKVIVFYMLDGNVVEDTIFLTAVGAPGSSKFETLPLIAAQDFGTKTECDNTDSTSWTIQNTGCDAMRVTDVSLDGNLAPSFAVRTDQTLPDLMTSNKLKVTLAIAQLVSGTYAGNIHVKFESAEGAQHDTLIPVKLTVTPGPHTLVMDATPIDLGSISGCEGHDTAVYISDQGCAGLQVKSIAMTGAGFGYLDTVNFVPSGKTLPIHIHYDGSGSGAITGQLTVTTNSDANPNRTINFTANVQAAQSVNFVVKVSTMPVKKNEVFDVAIYPDRDATITGLNSVSGVIEYYDDNFEAPITPTTMAGTSLGTWSKYRIGKYEHCKFAVTSPSGIVLKQSTPVLTLKLQEMISDSVASTIVVDSLAMGSSMPNFGDCITTNMMTSTSTSFSSQCGDSLVISVMRGDGILLIAPPNPNPLTHENGGKVHFGLTPTNDGSAQIEIFDALGRSRTKRTQSLSNGSNDVQLDLSSLEGGSYYYTIHFESVAGTAEHRGSLVVVK
jgi:photosystem II stability/assembly factor-like uncharacterized protein